MYTHPAFFKMLLRTKSDVELMYLLFFTLDVNLSTIIKISTDRNVFSSQQTLNMSDNLFTITGAQKYHVTSGSSKALRKGHLHVRPFAQCIADHYGADVPLR